ncbi:MAG: MarR family transcriptional regulator [Candidatus Bathyarchaeota archaeon]|jgi:DNA-binding CsgD family transcriptional regulator|nr:MarR family transcriptional regulator [Candidatus Bathyarchaeota archaeon]
MSAFSLSVAILYHRRLREAWEKYRNAKSVLEDVMISFSRQLKRHDGQVETSARKIDFLMRQSKLLAEGLGELQTLRAEMGALPSAENIKMGIAIVQDRVKGFDSALDALSRKVSGIETLQRNEKVVEPRIESAIPIKREKALEPLTETELSVLELLSSEGEKTSPEVKERIKLSREHTARLMKKLYEKGYLERNSGKTPFAYHLKEEMQKILRKPEQRSSPN